MSSPYPGRRSGNRCAFCWPSTSPPSSSAPPPSRPATSSHREQVGDDGGASVGVRPVSLRPTRISGVAAGFGGVKPRRGWPVHRPAHVLILFLFLGGATGRRLDLTPRFPGGRAAQKQKDRCRGPAGLYTGQP